MADKFSQNNILFGISQQGEVVQNASLTVLLDKEEISRIFALAKQYGSLSAARRQNGFHLTVGTHQFYTAIETARSSITFEDVMELSVEMAGLFVELADIIFPKRQANFMLLTNNTESEFTVWQQAINHEILLETRNEQQMVKFQRWQQALNEAKRNKSSILRQMPNEHHAAHLPQTSFSPKVPHNIALQLNYGALSPLCDLMIAYGEIELAFINGMLELHIDDVHLSIVVEHNRVTLNILSLDLSKPGAGELLAKILDTFFYDKQRRIEITMPQEARLKVMWRALHQAGVRVEARNPEQARLLAQFAKEWLSEHRQQFTTLFNQLKQSGDVNLDVTLENN